VVASSGTSLTVEQIRLIGRYTKNITVLYDGDAAGIKASLRGIDLILEEGLNVRVVLFTDGDDPDSYRRKHGSSVLVDFIQENSKDFVVFKTGLLLKDVANDPARKAALVKEIVETIALIPDPITRSLYLKQCSEMLDTPEQLLIGEMNKQRRKQLGKSMPVEEAGQLQPENVISHVQENVTEQSSIREKEIVRLLLNYGNHDLHFTIEVDAEDEPTGKKEAIEKVKVFRFIVREIAHDDIEFEHDIYNRILKEFTKMCDEGEECDVQRFLNSHEPEISSVAVELLSIRYFLSENWEQMHRITVPEEVHVLQDSVEKSILYLKKEKVLKMLDENMKLIHEAQQRGEDCSELLREHMRIEQLKIDISKGALGIDILR
jgi:DNA primase